MTGISKVEIMIQRTEKERTLNEFKLLKLSKLFVIFPQPIYSGRKKRCFKTMNQSLKLFLKIMPWLILLDEYIDYKKP